MKRIRIEVTAEHIKKGRRRRLSYCPVALALREFGLGDPSVGYCYIEDDANEKLWETPDRVKAFLRKFDDSKPVKPFVFTLEAK